MDATDRQALVAALAERGISDERVLDAIGSIPREAFVSEAFRGEAYLDTALPIECEQTISQPFVVAYMTERLRIMPDSAVLEVGTGSGYQAAILAKIAKHVYTIERYEALYRVAVERFRKLGLKNITAILGDGMQGWPETNRKFDRIIVTAGAPGIPDALLRQLTAFGMMMIPLGPRRVQHLTLVIRMGKHTETQKLLPVRFVPLRAGAEEGKE